ncbi:hypothetical protein ACQP2F_15835 [Actinoplanes sp. CA-030573]
MQRWIDRDDPKLALAPLWPDSSIHFPSDVVGRQAIDVISDGRPS